MRRTGIVLVGCICGLFLFVTVALAADKFASVDVMRIASEYGKAKDYNKSLDTKATAAEADINKKLDEIKQLQDKINLLSEKEKAAKKAELDTKIKDLQEFRRQKEMDLRKEDFENTKDVVENIKAAIKQYAEKEGFAQVFDDRALVYQSKGMDITDKVVEILNSKDSKK